jgi:hypothetical protein
MQQELVSRCQLSERLIDFGWLPNDPILDLGEDFIVTIYIDYEATGVPFHVQVKSITDLHKRQSRDGGYLWYSFKVKDLLHWDSLDFPVVLIVWDVKLREGKWILADSAIAELDQRRPQWRKNKTKTRVHIPWSNTTDDDGLARLRREIGLRLYSIIVRDEPFDIKVSLALPDTEVGRSKLAAWERSVKEGEQVTFSGDEIRSWEPTGWFGKWFGGDIPEELTMGGPVSQEVRMVDVHFVDVQRQPTSFTNVELRVEKAGTELLQLTNKHQIYPIYFTFQFRKTGERIQRADSIHVTSSLWRYVCDADKVLRFLCSYASGGRLTIAFHGTDNAPIGQDVPPGSFEAPRQGFVRLFSWLCEKQSEIGRVIPVPQEWTDADWSMIDTFTPIFEVGQRTVEYKKGAIECGRELLEAALERRREDQPLYVRMHYHKITERLFGVDVPLGCMTRTIYGQVLTPVCQLEEALRTLSPGERHSIAFGDLAIVYVFPDIAERFGIVMSLPNNDGD